MSTDLLGDDQPITKSEMLKCVRREIAMRKSAYPRWIAAGKMKQPAADREIAVMEQVFKTLEAMAPPAK